MSKKLKRHVSSVREQRKATREVNVGHADRLTQKKKAALTPAKGKVTHINKHKPATTVVDYQKEVTGTFKSVKRKIPTTATAKNIVQVNTAWGNIGFPVESIKSFQSTLPPLPFSLFTKISGYLQWCALTHNAEGRIDLTLIEGEWVAICFHQTAQHSLDVKVDFDTAENRELMTPELKEAFGRIHSTIHSHTTSNAFQSGTDEADEMNKDGWHITLGTYGSGTVANHARYTVKKKAERDENGVRTAPALNFFFEVNVGQIVAPRIVEEEEEDETRPFTQAKMKKAKVGENFSLVSPYPEEWEERFTKHTPPARVVQVNTGPPNGYSNQTGDLYGDYEWTDEDIKAAITDWKKQSKKKGSQKEAGEGEEDDFPCNDQDDFQTIEAFEVMTCMDFVDLEAFISEIGDVELKDKGELIMAWFEESLMSDKIRTIPEPQALNRCLFQCNDIKDLPILIAEEFCEKTL